MKKLIHNLIIRIIARLNRIDVWTNDIGSSEKPLVFEEHPCSQRSRLPDNNRLEDFKYQAIVYEVPIPELVQTSSGLVRVTRGTIQSPLFRIQTVDTTSALLVKVSNPNVKRVVPIDELLSTYVVSSAPFIPLTRGV